jgi:cephalosporin-C deacetylase-like acetyl esterase
MKKTLLCFFISVVYFNSIPAQNFLPLVWKISFTETSPTEQTLKNTDSWESVNLLLSWERQGYSASQGKCCLSSDFTVADKYADSTLVLKLGLQCFVREVYINSNRIGGNLPNQFWTNRDASTEFKIPGNVLHKGSANRIDIYASDLSYTGGLSHNSCTLSPANTTQKNNIRIIIPEANHVITNRTPSLKIRFKASQKGMVKLCIKNDFHKTFVTRSFPVTPADTLLSIDLKKEITTPGFYECVALLNDNGHTGDVQWFALSPEKIDCKTETISGFKQYWNNTLSELHTVNPDFKLHRVDSLSTATRDGYVVEMKSLGNITIRGYYFVPKTTGKHAAILHVPGYGWGYQNQSQFLNSTENVVELALCVRGHGISTDVFKPEFDVPGIWGYKIYSEQDNAYRGIYADCVRAVDFLLSQPEIDSTRVGVMGGSQGGGLTLATAGLCKNKIAACAYFDPFQCDIRDFVNIREVCKGEINAYLKYYNNAYSLEQAMHVQDLINTKGFANWITCPVFFASSLFDDDCPPHVGFAAYNTIKTSKQYKVYPNDSHLGESNYNKEFMLYFKRQFKF